jgi:hypothetical protein
MRVVPQVEEEIRRVIRDARAKDPLIRVGRIKKLLEEKYQRGFSYQYIAKLVEKVARQSFVETDRTQIEQRINFTRENYRMMREEMLKIVYWTADNAKPHERRPLVRDRIEAAKNVVMMDLALLQAEIANGMYKKEVETLAQEFRYQPLREEIRTVIIASWKRGGLLPAATIENMVPVRLDR